MQRVQVRYEGEFRVIAGDAESQAAVMVLAPGESTGGADNEHPQSAQWLYVSSGTGVAVVAGRRYELQPHTLIRIDKGEPHDIRCTGTGPLETLNVYVPPAYDEEGAPLQS